MSAIVPGPSAAELFTPKLVTALAEGYGPTRLKADIAAGLTVAIVALPLAMAIGVASGASPQAGLVTAVVAGFLVSALGGSRVQIGGPTAAFITVVYATIQAHGYDGMLLATFLAGLMLVAVGALRLGGYIKYIPYPVVIGFTAGIAVAILVSQAKELLGLRVALGGEFGHNLAALWGALPTAQPGTIALSALSIGVVLGVKRFAPRVPNMLAAVVMGSLAALAFGLDADTIGSRFGGVPQGLPAPRLPELSWAKVVAVLPSAATIALLAGVESLLSAVIADGLTGRRHRSNCELVAQGLANCASALVGGLSATGAIARTATNVRAGAQTPVAGMLHAVFLLAFMLLAAPLLAYVPLATLGAILAVVAWNIAEIHAIRTMLARAPMGDRAVLVVTFVLTVAVDLTVAIQVGIVMSAMLFMHRMAESVEVAGGARPLGSDDGGSETPGPTPGAGEDWLVYRIEGPFFFGATTHVVSALERVSGLPRRLVIDFSAVPFVDASAAVALLEFVGKARSKGTAVTIAGARPGPRRLLEQLGLASAVDFQPSVAAAIGR